MKLKVKKLHPDAKLPTYATTGAACFDLYALAVDGYQHTGSLAHHGCPVICRTGLAFEIPDGHTMLVFSRSGHGFNHDVRLANAVGVIDADFIGEVMVKLTADYNHAREDAPPLQVSPGDRVAQALVLPVERVEFIEVEHLAATERGEGGFGSTGA